MSRDSESPWKKECDKEECERQGEFDLKKDSERKFYGNFAFIIKFSKKINGIN